MEKFVRFEGLVAPLDRANVDTDAIIPMQFLKSIRRSGFGPYLFDRWRYLDVGEPGMECTNRPRNVDFVLNLPRYAGASILLSRENFGCGSSREHAPWALRDYGFKAIVAESFADIFFNNCFKNGLLPIALPAEEIDALFGEVESTPGYRLRVDLSSQTLERPDGKVIAIDVDPFRKECLLEGWDDVGLTLRHADEIRAFEDARKARKPWLFA
jgi:3-isopropylmalate/(R)-2-methylmalate dehydratase small subunit